MNDIVIFGAVSSGKSTFINALFGDNVAKTGDGITTSEATKYKYNDKLNIIDLPGINEDTGNSDLFIQRYKPYFIKAKIVFCIFDKTSAYTMKKIYDKVMSGRDIKDSYFILNKSDEIDDIDDVINGINETVGIAKVVVTSSRLAYSSIQYNKNVTTPDNIKFLKKYLFTKELNYHIVNKAYINSNFSNIKLLLEKISTKCDEELNDKFIELIERNNIIPNQLLFNLYDFRQTSICSFKDTRLERNIINLKYIVNSNIIDRFQSEYLMWLCKKEYLGNRIFNMRYIVSGNDITYVKNDNKFYKVYIQYDITNTEQIKVNKILGYTQIYFTS